MCPLNPNLEDTLRQFVLFLSAAGLMLAIMITSTPASAQSTSLTAEQQAWIQQLTQNPERIDKIMQMESDRALAARWNQVSTITVNDLHVALGLSGRNSTGAVTQVKIGTKVYPWLSIATPKDAAMPIFIKIEWYHPNDPTDAYRMVTVDISSPSPAWRTWDAMTLRTAGTWTIKVEYAGSVLSTTTVEVTP